MSLLQVRASREWSIKFNLTFVMNSYIFLYQHRNLTYERTPMFLKLVRSGAPFIKLLNELCECILEYGNVLLMQDACSRFPEVLGNYMDEYTRWKANFPTFSVTLAALKIHCFWKRVRCMCTYKQIQRFFAHGPCERTLSEMTYQAAVDFFKQASIVGPSRRLVVRIYNLGHLLLKMDNIDVPKVNITQPMINNGLLNTFGKNTIIIGENNTVKLLTRASARCFTHFQCLCKEYMKTKNFMNMKEELMHFVVLFNEYYLFYRHWGDVVAPTLTNQPTQAERQ